MTISLREFAEAFSSSFVVNRGVLRWDTKQLRTAHMTAYIYRTLAGCFPGAEVRYEHDGIDAALFSDGKLEVAMEHENDVLTIATELKALLRIGAPLSVLVTYTGGREEYLKNRHKAAFADFADEQLLIIVNREDWVWSRHKPGEPIPWEFLTLRNRELVSFQ